MYESFFGFKEKPFNTTPDSRYFFPSEKHSEALNSLIYAINERKGFVVITGEIGAGKTTITRALLNKCDPNTRVALITNTHLTSRELIVEVLSELEVDYKPGSKHKLLARLNEYLVSQLALDINIVLIIDEAQNLSPKVLEEVRMLSNLETEREKLIQIILIGQPQLKAKLEHPGLEQFKQRVAIFYHLRALSGPETADYIRHRLHTAGTVETDIFTPEAVDAVYEYSKGTPRLINLVCDSALLFGYTYDRRVIGKEIINEVIRERNFSPTGRTPAAPNSGGAAMHCCKDCDKYSSCETKWIRGVKGLEQICCPDCANYPVCTAVRSTLSNGSESSKEH